ncbi:MAG: ribosome maturation factor RimP [Pseudomonadota bacterium]
MALQQIVEQTVAGFGYDLIEVERSAGGLLRITIDLPWVAGVEQFVTVEDCEKVTRQLQFALEVDGVVYQRLEVSSPGIDRPLRHAQDFERFVGEVVDITLKAPIGSAAVAASNAAAGLAGVVEPGATVPAGYVNANRKKFRGTLEKTEAGWQVVWSDAPQAKPGQKVSRKRSPVPMSALGFTLEEIRDARLAPIVDFKGRRPKDVAE